MDGVLQLGAMGKACHNDGDPLGLDMGPFTRFADDIYGFFVFFMVTEKESGESRVNIRPGFNNGKVHWGANITCKVSLGARHLRTCC